MYLWSLVHMCAHSGERMYGRLRAHVRVVWQASCACACCVAGFVHMCAHSGEVIQPELNL